MLFICCNNVPIEENKIIPKKECKLIERSALADEVEIKLVENKSKDSVGYYTIQFYNNSNDTLLFLTPKLSPGNFIGLYSIEYADKNKGNYSNLLFYSNKDITISEPAHTINLTDDNSTCLQPKNKYEFSWKLDRKNSNVNLNNKKIRFRYHTKGLAIYNCTNCKNPKTLNDIYYSNIVKLK